MPESIPRVALPRLCLQLFISSTTHLNSWPPRAPQQLQRAIYQGSFSKPRGRREVEQIAMSGSLTLMTNLCLAWTATGDQTKFCPANFKRLQRRSTF